MEAVKTMIHDQDLPMHLWVEATIIVVYVQNKLSHSALGFKTLKEMFFGKKPKVSHINIFGCPVFAHILKERRTKLDPSIKKGIFVGYCEVSTAFRIYIPGYHHIEINRDVTFDEGKKSTLPTVTISPKLRTTFSSKKTEKISKTKPQQISGKSSSCKSAQLPPVRPVGVNCKDYCTYKKNLHVDQKNLPHVWTCSFLSHGQT
jgi:hypothetical protein